ncbi:MAG: KTSC domain-containing protein [Nocardioidaceae bacterium]|nr:KTSC domain-containing protein [Nocardioidaceae bacterium]
MHRSRALAEAGYDPAARVLRLRFVGGGLYEYLGVPPEIFEGLRTSAHPWTEWQTRIKEHAFRRLD